MKSVVMVQQRLVYFAFSLQEGCFFSVRIDIFLKNFAAFLFQRRMARNQKEIGFNMMLRKKTDLNQLFDN